MIPHILYKYHLTHQVICENIVYHVQPSVPKKKKKKNDSNYYYSGCSMCCGSEFWGLISLLFYHILIARFSHIKVQRLLLFIREIR